MGEIIVSNPSAQDVEDEKFDLDFSLIVVSDEDIEKMKTAAASVSEIASVVGEAIVLENMAAKDKYEDAAPEPEPQPQAVPPAAVERAVEAAPAAEAASKPAAPKAGDKSRLPASRW